SFPWGFKFELTRCNAYANALTPVDLFPNGSSPYNVFDMSGNVWEWCTPIEPLHDIETEEILAVLKGGAWKHTDPDYFQVGFRRIFSADSAGATAGFRIAKVL
ncbi:MAG: formylglycine-generating enzyme family protein, partial [Aggregatilineales bacterium]